MSDVADPWPRHAEIGAAAVKLPGAHAFVERRGETRLDPWIEDVVACFSALGAGPRRHQALRLGGKSVRLMQAFAEIDDGALGRSLVAAARALRRSPDTEDAICKAAALIGETSVRTLGLRPFVVQVAAGIAMYRGGAVEMDTGEGKTLATMIAATLHALAGRAVHVVSANDYLAERDGTDLGLVYERLGLTVGIIKPDLQPEARRSTYRRDIVYVSSKEVAFDYLRDRLAGLGAPGNRDILIKTWRALRAETTRQPVLRGLDVALVDEIDSVLIDDAGTPLLISTEVGSDSATLAAQALEMVSELREDEDFHMDRLRKQVSLTDKGIERIEVLSKPWGGAMNWPARPCPPCICSAAMSTTSSVTRRSSLSTATRVVRWPIGSGGRAFIR